MRKQDGNLIECMAKSLHFVLSYTHILGITFEKSKSYDPSTLNAVQSGYHHY